MRYNPVLKRAMEGAVLLIVGIGAATGIVHEHGRSSVTNALTAPIVSMVDTPKTIEANAMADLNAPQIDKWVARWTTEMRSTMESGLTRMASYDKMISGKLAAREMPKQLIFLAMVESNFNPKAQSPARASGLWQFVSGTAKMYGLTVNKRVDERNNPALATDAALKYLQTLHDRFGSWYLAAAAYNCGEGCVSRVMKSVTGQEKGTDADFFRIASRLPQETQNYVPKIVAAARIAANPTQYGFTL